MNRFRLIDEVSIYLLDRNNCHITLLYVIVNHFLVYRLVFNRTLSLYVTSFSSISYLLFQSLLFNHDLLLFLSEVSNITL